MEVNEYLIVGSFHLELQRLVVSKNIIDSLGSITSSIHLSIRHDKTFGH